MASDDSLRDQLCQIEQSLGVCHVAEVQEWQKVKDTEKPTEIPVGSALAGSLIRNSNQIRAVPPSDRFGPQLQAVPPVQPMQPVQPVERESHLGVAPPVPPPVPLDADLMTKLDAAVDQLIKGSVRRFTSDSTSTIIELGPAGPGPNSQPGGPGRLVKGVELAPRLPQQLAEIRQQLRQLSADCDRLQALAVEPEEDAIENVEAEHASTMCQANQLLDALNSECEATE